MCSTIKRFFFILLVLGLFVSSAVASDLNLFVAASMKDSVTQISEDFIKKKTGISFQRNFGSSGALAKQIENGAPCDIFVSANVKWVDYLKEKKLIDAAGIATLAFNEVVFVGSPELDVKRLEDLVGLDKIAIGSPKSVPAGEYAMAAITKAGIADKLEKKMVMAKDVREALMYADRGEVDGAFVYKTDALLARHVKILFIVPQEFYPKVTYPVALTRTGAKKPEALAFFKYLQSPDAKSILLKFGFAVK